MSFRSGGLPVVRKGHRTMLPVYSAATCEIFCRVKLLDGVAVDADPSDGQVGPMVFIAKRRR